MVVVVVLEFVQHVNDYYVPMLFDDHLLLHHLIMSMVENKNTDDND